MRSHAIPDQVQAGTKRLSRGCASIAHAIAGRSVETSPASAAWALTVLFFARKALALGIAAAACGSMVRLP